MDKCMPTPPKRVGREFIRQYYIIMNKSPENLYCFYNDEAHYIQDDIDLSERRTITADGRMAIRNAIIERFRKYRHTSTKIITIDTIETLGDSFIIQIQGEISFNEEAMRPFAQTVILVPKTPFQFMVQNDIFRFCDFVAQPLRNDNEQKSVQPIQLVGDWASLCEEQQIQCTKLTVTTIQIEPRAELITESEVRSDASDSGVSSDTEKTIMDIQSQNLKNILQESRSITKEMILKCGPTPPSIDEPLNNVQNEMANKQMCEKKNQLFRDSCILTIGNIINPNIEFDDMKPIESASESETKNSMQNDECNGKLSKVKLPRKRKDRRKIRNDSIKDDTTNDPKTSNEKIKSQCNYENALTTNNIEIKTYADLVKKEQNAKHCNEESILKRNSYGNGNDQYKTRITMRRRSDKITPPKDDCYRSSQMNDLLQVFIGNIPHSAVEDDILKMFSCFGRISRFRLHSNPKKDWLPRYAFITYENIQSVRMCIAKKNSFYWPQNCADAQKLNVNADPSIDVNEDRPRRLHDTKSRELKRFSENFVLPPRKHSNKELADEEIANAADTMKNERRKRSARA